VWQGYTGKVELISFRTFLTKPVRRVSLGGEHSLILTYDDCLFACGSNQHGQLGCPNLAREYMFDPCLVDAVCGRFLHHLSHNEQKYFMNP
jgi:alpha-tubulin suppressor-like RCC1 family protein